MIKARRAADRFGRDPEMVAERAGECFVRAVIRIQCQRENIRCAARERACRLGQAPRAHITHHRKSGRSAKRPHQMEARDTGDAGDLVERQRTGEMTFDKPERLLGRIHWTAALIQSAHMMPALRAAHLTVLAHRYPPTVPAKTYLVPSFAAGAVSFAGGASTFFFKSSAVFFCALCKSS